MELHIVKKIEPMFADFKSNGFGLKDTQLWYTERVDHLILIMTLAMYWCVEISIEDSIQSPTLLKTKTNGQCDKNHWSIKKQARSLLSWFQRSLRKLLRLSEFGLPLPDYRTDRW